jgi:hypothetical protein
MLCYLELVSIVRSFQASALVRGASDDCVPWNSARFPVSRFVLFHYDTECNSNFLRVRTSCFKAQNWCICPSLRTFHAVSNDFCAFVMFSNVRRLSHAPVWRASLFTDFLGFRQSQLILFECIIFYSYYISTTCFGPYEAIFRWIIYTSYFMRTYFLTTDPLVVLLVIDCIYFYALCFGDFSPLSACMWLICLFIILIRYLNICHFTLKLINSLNNDVLCRYFSIKYCTLKRSSTYKMSKKSKVK